MIGTIEELTPLYQELYCLIQQMCQFVDGRCVRMRARGKGCCGQRACEKAIKYAREYWNVTVEPGPELPCLGEHGCVLPPEMRPYCTLYICNHATLNPVPDYHALRARFHVILAELKLLNAPGIQWEVSDSKS